MDRFLQEIINMRKIRHGESEFHNQNLQAGEIFLVLGRIFGKVPMEFQLCNTYTRTSCMISINEKKFLLYDEYLTETFQEMNLLFFRYGHNQNIEKYCCRLLADQLYSIGKYDAAIYMIREYVDRKPYYKGESLEKTLEEKVVRYAVIQQWMIVGHELAHWYIRENERKRQILVKKKELLLDIFSYGKISENSKLFQEQIKTEDEIAEECFCDSAAVMMVLDALGGSYQIEEISEAIFLTIEHIRILADMETFSEVGERAGKDFALQAAVRLAHIRFVLADLAGDNYGEEKKKEIFQRLGRIFKKYNMEMYYPAVELIRSVSQNGLKYLLKHEEIADGELVFPLLEQLI